MQLNLSVHFEKENPDEYVVGINVITLRALIPDSETPYIIAALEATPGVVVDGHVVSTEQFRFLQSLSHQIAGDGLDQSF